MVAPTEEYTKAKTKDKEYQYCLRCGRKLKNSKARKLGYGIICYKKSKQKKRLF